MSGARWAGAVTGGLVAGLAITAMLMAGERRSGKPSELADLERAAATRLGMAAPTADTLPDTREQLVIQGGHLLLSAVAGAAYAATSDDDAAVALPGAAFGVAFYAAMHWIAGPLLGLKRPEWRSEPATIAMHAVNHVVFGVVTAAGARLTSRR